ncbi:MAG: hypothetical protein E7005_07255 [Alphaproteobacteria bacterium]|nr:hypothetical protein [Alphaproteobacteria bacterium]
MQLISLWVEDFKNLKNFTINFENQENLSIIIGNNGSGKSNILELLSGIFAELYENKEFIESSYTLIYSINDKILEITKEYEDGEKDFTTYKVNGITKNKSFLRTQNLLPNNIIALYSGEDDRLYKTYYEYFANSYLRSLSKVLALKNSMIYIDKKYWGIALLAFIIKAQEDDRDAQVFLNKELNIDEILDIYLEFDPSKIKKLKYNSPLELFIRNINPGKSPLINMSIEFFYPFIGDCRAEELFSILAQGITIGAIKDVSLVFNDDNIPSEHMSEGEKKKLLVKAVFDILGTENSLILMDEPDAHLHVAAKDYFYNLAKQSAVDRRCIVITTHSPTLTNCADDKHIIMLTRNSDGNCEIIDTDRKECIKKLTNGLWSAEEEHIFFASKKPLILVEGKGDVAYIKSAIKILNYPLDINILPVGGARNAKCFIDEIKQEVKDRTVIMFFDRDDAGADGLKDCVNQTDHGRIDLHTYKVGNIYYLMLPKLQIHTEIDFLIEDYLPIDLKKTIAHNITDQGQGFFNKYVKDLKEKLKKELAKPDYQTKENYEGFRVLLDKIKEIIDGNSIQNLVEIN